MCRQINALSLFVLSAAIGWSQYTTAFAQQLIVFPAVSKEVEGLHDSRWMTEVRIVKVDPRVEVTLTRKWVCLPDGGYIDDPHDPFTVRMENESETGRVVRFWGDDLIGDTEGDLGAVAFEVSGGEVIATSYVVDVSRGEHLRWRYTAGQGQYIRAMEEPLVGPSHIPWTAGCRNVPCSAEEKAYWDFHRNNIGVVNPNPEPLTITGKVLAFGGFLSDEREIYPVTTEVFSREIPPYGWMQFRWISEEIYGGGPYGTYYPPEGGFVINLIPDSDSPYYAYASVVFTPDPESENQIFNDPLFVPAEPGYIEPFREAFPPKDNSE